MKTINVYQENETVMIKAKISRVIFEKDKILYELKDFNTEQKYLSLYSDKDIIPFSEEERSANGDNFEGVDGTVATSSRLANGQGF